MDINWIITRKEMPLSDQVVFQSHVAVSVTYCPAGEGGGRLCRFYKHPCPAREGGTRLVPFLQTSLPRRGRRNSPMPFLQTSLPRWGRRSWRRPFYYKH